MIRCMLHPEVAGSWGEDTVTDPKEMANPWPCERVTYLDYCFEDWFGDHLIETHPCFAVTQQLADAIIKAGLTGVRFERMTMSYEDQFHMVYENKPLPLPQFVRLVPVGKTLLNGKISVEVSELDFATASNIEVNSPFYCVLCVSEKALEVLKRFPLTECEIHKWDI